MNSSGIGSKVAGGLQIVMVGVAVLSGILALTLSFNVAIPYLSLDLMFKIFLGSSFVGLLLEAPSSIKDGCDGRQVLRIVQPKRSITDMFFKKCPTALLIRSDRTKRGSAGHHRCSSPTYPY